MPQFVTDIVNAPFMNEPLWRWFIAVGAFLFMLGAWEGIIDFMK